MFWKRNETYSLDQKAELKQAVVKLVPDKIDIGAIYNCPPKTKHDRFYPMGRELVFDLDATDCIRTCPCADTICVRCWPLMMVSVKIIHKCLTEDLGFEHILWVYSGRRGVHCWVSDERARYLTNEARTQVVDFILRQCFKQDYMNILRPFFRQRLNAEKLFDGTSLAEEFKCSYDTWSHDLKSNHLVTFSFFFFGFFFVDETCQEALVVKAVGPKLDVKVTVRMDHLLKCPYSPHPKTKQLCVPIPNIDTFDPFSVPVRWSNR